MHMLRSGARWRDCSAEFGPYTTIYNRFNRWSRQGIWLAIFKALTGRTAVISTAAIDHSHVKAHRSAAAERGAFEEAIGRSRGGRRPTPDADHARPPTCPLDRAGNISRRDAWRRPPWRRWTDRTAGRRQGYDTNRLRTLLDRAQAKPSSRRPPVATIPPTIARPTASATSSNACSPASRTSDVSHPLRQARTQLPCWHLLAAILSRWLN